MLLKKRTIKETAQCRYCEHAAVRDGLCYCRKRGGIIVTQACRLYSFDPFAERTPRRRNIDTSALDPLDFEI